MISRTFFRPAEATVPPVPVTRKNSSSWNSQASDVCATNTRSRWRYWRRRPWIAQKKKVLRDLPLALAHAARDVEQQDHDGLHRRLLALGELAIAQVVVGEGRVIRPLALCTPRRLIDSFSERRRSRRERAPRRSQPSRVQSSSLARPPSLRDSAAASLPTASRRCRRCGTRACTGCRRLRCRPGRADCRWSCCGRPMRSPGLAWPWPTPCCSLEVRSLKR